MVHLVAELSGQTDEARDHQDLFFDSSHGGLHRRVYLADLGRWNFALFYREEYFLFSVDSLSDPHRNSHRMVWRQPDLSIEGKIKSISENPLVPFAILITSEG